MEVGLHKKSLNNWCAQNLPGKNNTKNKFKSYQYYVPRITLINDKDVLTTNDHTDLYHTIYSKQNIPAPLSDTDTPYLDKTLMLLTVIWTFIF